MPPAELTATLTVLNLALTLCALALGAAWRHRARADRDAAARRLEALAERVARMEARGAATVPGPESPLVPRSPRRGHLPRPEPAAGPTLIAVPNLAAPAGEPTASASSDLNQRFGAIWGMADTGASAESIARDTGQPIGQVELILGLRRQVGGSGVERPRLP